MNHSPTPGPSAAGPAAAASRPVPGRIRRKYRRAACLWLAAFGLALALCGSETVSGGRRISPVPDQFNALVLVMSFRDALLEGQLPPRVSPILSGGAGNPYHQFYSPLAYAIPALLSLPLGDAMAGHAAASLLFTALGFVYAWKLSRLLTLSDAGVAAGALLFTTAPYLLCDRVLRGAWPEFAGFSLLPLTAYLLLRGANGGAARRLLPAAAGLAALSLTHLIASFLLALFLSLFAALWGLNCLWAGGPEGRRALRKLGRRAARVAAAGVAAFLLAACYLAPMSLQGDLVMKHYLQAQGQFPATGLLTSLLSLISPASSDPVLENLTEPERYQLGAWLLLSVAAYAHLLLRGSPRRLPGRPAHRPLHALPLLLTAALAAAVVLAPGGAETVFPPAAYAQFSYRYIMILVLCAAPMGAMALAGLSRRAPRRPSRAGRPPRPSPSRPPPSRLPTSASRRRPALRVTGGVPMEVSKARIYREHPTLIYGDNAYFRWPPGADRIGRDVPAARGGGTSANRVFRIDLSGAPRLPGDPGAVLLDVLWYPGLQEVKARLDGRELTPGLGTFWQFRPGLGFLPTEDWPFHGLILRGLPDSGLLEAEVRFTGMRRANLVSAAALAFLAASCLSRLAGTLRRRGPASPRPAGRRRSRRNGALPGAAA
ncbi:MAG: hypothetical protein LBG06_09945 [Deltaproteobacteria bacterium]|jgi:hypothetical protein|nr:hypothetical protein [Deltaproteobacteria bacterium]